MPPVPLDLTQSQKETPPTRAGAGVRDAPAPVIAPTGTRNRRLIAFTMFLIWLGVVTDLTTTHRFWRDEIRAFSLALQGAGIIQMLRGLHGEGHPALWYLLLRGAHVLCGRPEVLPAVSLLVAVAAMLTLVLRAPFGNGVIAAILFSQYALYEYSVSARNYGISMLLVFLFAALYRGHRSKGILLGVLLFLLPNSSVPSALLVGSLLLFWFGDVLFAPPSDRRALWHVFLPGVALAFFGIVLSFLTVFPTYNDAIVIDTSAITLRSLTNAVLSPQPSFALSVIPWTAALLFPAFGGTLWIVVRSLILFGSALGLIRHKGAFIAGLLSVPAFSLFFSAVYQGFYRHHVMWVVLMVGLYWLAAANGKGPEHRVSRVISRGGTILFVFVLVQQVPWGIATTVTNLQAASDKSHHAAEFINKHPELRQSVVIADPDYFLETLPYYISNPTYLMREQRYGKVVHFTRKALLRLNAGEVLRNARLIRQATNRPVVILLANEMKPLDATQIYREGYDWEFVITPEQSRAFLSSTQFLMHHTAPPGSAVPPPPDEGYYAYVLY